MRCCYKHYATDRRQCSSDADRFYAHNHFNLGILPRCTKHAIPADFECDYTEYPSYEEAQVALVKSKL